jgi:L-malate glycosyltransferase
MDLETVLPLRVPTMYMTPELADLARANGRHPVAFLPVPVDMQQAAEPTDPAAFRRACGVRPHETLILTVSRLDNWIKSESLVRTMLAMEELGHEFSSARFVVVGDGEARSQLEERARQVNRTLEQDAVILFGELVDPRSAYAAADVVVGMGGSALRGMASNKPVIIVGKNGFARCMDANSQQEFLYKGMYGSGDGTNASLLQSMRRLIGDSSLRLTNAAIGQQFVKRHFSLPVATASLEDFLRTAQMGRTQPLTRLSDGLRMVTVYFASRILPASVKGWVRSLARHHRIGTDLVRPPVVATGSATIIRGGEHAP